MFVRSVSEAVFTTNLLRLLRQDKVDLDKVAAHLHGAAPPDKHRESSRFMEPLLSELLQTFKKISPPESSPEDNDELVRAKRKLKAAGLELSPPVKRRTSEMSEPSSSARKSEPPLPVEQSPAQVILNKGVERKPASYPSTNTKAAMDAWLKSHQSQFRSQTVQKTRRTSDRDHQLEWTREIRDHRLSCALRPQFETCSSPQCYEPGDFYRRMPI